MARAADMLPTKLQRALGRPSLHPDDSAGEAAELLNFLDVVREGASKNFDGVVRRLVRRNAELEHLCARNEAELQWARDQLARLTRSAARAEERNARQAKEIGRLVAVLRLSYDDSDSQRSALQDVCRRVRGLCEILRPPAVVGREGGDVSNVASDSGDNASSTPARSGSVPETDSVATNASDHSELHSHTDGAGGVDEKEGAQEAAIDDDRDDEVVLRMARRNVELAKGRLVSRADLLNIHDELESLRSRVVDLLDEKDLFVEARTVTAETARESYCTDSASRAASALPLGEPDATTDEVGSSETSASHGEMSGHPTRSTMRCPLETMRGSTALGGGAYVDQALNESLVGTDGGCLRLAGDPVTFPRDTAEDAMFHRISRGDIPLGSSRVCTRLDSDWDAPKHGCSVLSRAKHAALHSGPAELVRRAALELSRVRLLAPDRASLRITLKSTDRRVIAEAAASAIVAYAFEATAIDIAAASHAFGAKVSVHVGAEIPDDAPAPGGRDDVAALADSAGAGTHPDSVTAEADSVTTFAPNTLTSAARSAWGSSWGPLAWLSSSTPTQPTGKTNATQAPYPGHAATGTGAPGALKGFLARWFTAVSAPAAAQTGDKADETARPHEEPLISDAIVHPLARQLLQQAARDGEDVSTANSVAEGGFRGSIRVASVTARPATRLKRTASSPMSVAGLGTGALRGDSSKARDVFHDVHGAAGHAEDGASGKSLPMSSRRELRASTVSMPRRLPPAGRSIRRQGRGVRVLCLDGGGIRGLLMVDMLRRIERLTGRRIHEMFDMICGTSTGGFLALLVGLKRWPLGAAARAYDHIRTTFGGQYAILSEMKRFALGTSHDASDAEQMFEDMFGQETMSESATKPLVFVVAANVDAVPPSPYLFRNYELRHDAFQTAEFLGTSRCTIAEAARATTAAPTYYAPAEISGHKFVDGAILANSPLWVALSEAAVVWPDRELEMVVSMGCGDESVKPYAPQGVMSWVKILLELSMNPDMPHKVGASLLGDKYWRFSPNAGEGDVDLTESREEVLEKMLASGRRYIDREDARFQALSRALVAPRKSERTTRRR